nr:hypothetical protein Iba_chr06cCG7150 [Ipomoea batatas]
MDCCLSAQKLIVSQMGCWMTAQKGSLIQTSFRLNPIQQLFGSNAKLQHFCTPTTI